MAEIDRSTLMMSVQALDIAIREYRKYSASETVGEENPHDEFIYRMELAVQKLRPIYEKERKLDPGLPQFEELCGG